MALGGARPGAGRPKGGVASHTYQVQEARKALIARYIENQKGIDDALIAKALEKDVPAIKELYDRVFGKSMQALEISGKEGKDLFEPSDEIKKLANELLVLQKARRQ